MDLRVTLISKFDMFKKSVLIQAMKLGSCVVILLFFLLCDKPPLNLMS